MCVNSSKIPIEKEIIEAIKHFLKNLGFLKSSANEKDISPTKKEYPKAPYFIKSSTFIDMFANV